MMDHWNIQRTTFTVTDFLSWMRNGELELSPSFQRRPVWKAKSKSYFMDTIVRGLPVPIVFVRERIDIRSTKSIREVVDGQQRLRTVISFINSSLLPDFDRSRDEFSVSKAHNKEMAGLSYQSLPEDLKRAILGYQFSVDVLPRSSSDQDVLQIFKRMNSTGQKLNAQELRNAEFSGYFSQLAYNMALEQLDRWRQWGVFKEDEIARMEEVELSSEILIMIMSGVFGKTSYVLDRYYRDFEDKEVPYQPNVEDRFRTVFDKIDEILGGFLASSALRKKAVFFNVVAMMYDVLYGMKSDVSNSRRPSAIPTDLASNIMLADARLAAGMVPQEVQESAARRTTHISSRRALVNFLLESVGRGPLN